MSAEFRGRGRGRGGAGGGRGGAGAGARGPGGSRGEDRPKREAILDLAKYVDKKIRVKFTGGREGESLLLLLLLLLCPADPAHRGLVGTLKGYDQLLNLVMDDLEEAVNDPATGLPYVPARSRSLGLAVLRGTSLVVISPLDGSEEIANPFAG